MDTPITARPPRAAIIHDVRIWPAFFATLPVRTAEIRKNDRDYQAGDTVNLLEYDPNRDSYTGKSATRLISHVANGPIFAGAGLAIVPEGYAVLHLQHMPESEGDPVAKDVGTSTPRAPYDCMAKLAPGEPYFVLRAQDKLSPYLVRDWAQRARLNGCPSEKTEQALQVADAMETWPTQKYPD